jgi:hypothetical protein
VGTERRNVGMEWKHGLGMAPDDGRGSVLNKSIRTYYAKLARDSEPLLCRKGTNTEKMGL